MNLPIKVSELTIYLPHRPPMIWIDEVLSFSDKAGECNVRLKGDGLYMGPGGRLRPTSCLEFIAQAYGYISVCHHIYVLDPNSKPLSKAFLASIKDAVLPNAEKLNQLAVGDTLSISVAGFRQIGPIVSFTGSVKKNGMDLCTTQMKVFKEYQQ